MGQRLAHNLFGPVQDLHGILLDPARLRKNLPVLPLGRGNRAALRKKRRIACSSFPDRWPLHNVT